MKALIEREAAILAAAERLSRRRGEFTLPELARAAGVSRATLLRAFGSKAALLRKLAERGVGEPPDEAGTRSRVLRAARELFLARGIHDVTLAEIAQEAKVGEATLYRHFGSKEGLLQGIAGESRARQAARELLPERGRPEELLARFAAEFILQLRARPEELLLGLQTYRQDPALFAEVKGAPGRSLTLLSRYLGGLLSRGELRPADPAELAMIFIGMIFGLGWLSPTLELLPPGDAEAQGRLVAEVFLQGARAPTNKGGAP
jgi:AcrR family transcriptional regulator